MNFTDPKDMLNKLKDEHGQTSIQGWRKIIDLGWAQGKEKLLFQSLDVDEKGYLEENDVVGWTIYRSYSERTIGLRSD